MAQQTIRRRDFIAASLTGAAGILSMPMLSFATNAVQLLEGPAFATRWRVLCDHGADLWEVNRVVEATVAQIDRSMSPYRQDSEVSIFNAFQGDRALQVSGCLGKVLARADEISHLSGGAFDPGVGPLVSRVGFGPIEGEYVPFLEGIEIDGERVVKLDRNATLDLCGIAKGFAIDEIALRLQVRGVRDALIEIGGEFVALGRHPSGRAWRVAIENPHPGVDGAITVVNLENRAIATSGHRYQGINGSVKMSHIIDPATQRPANQRVLSATVIADTGIDADSWSTSLCALGPGPSVTLARLANLDALIVCANEYGPGTKLVRTGKFADHEVST